MPTNIRATVYSGWVFGYIIQRSIATGIIDVQQA